MREILAFGEPTHGGDETVKHRIKLFKELINQGYTNIILEEGYETCKIMNNYINGIDDDNPKKIIKNKFQLFYHTNTYVKFFKWLKNYNDTHKIKITLLGLDPFHIGNIKINNIPINNIIIKYKKNPNDKSRDYAMFKIFEILYKQNKKYIIWAHNYHISKNKYCLGWYLSKKYDYYNIAFTFNYGTFLGLNIKTGNHDIINVNDNNGINIKGEFKMIDKDVSNLYIRDAGFLVDKTKKNNIRLVKVKKAFDSVFVIDREKMTKWFSKIN